MVRVDKRAATDKKTCLFAAAQRKGLALPEFFGEVRCNLFCEFCWAAAKLSNQLQLRILVTEVAEQLKSLLPIPAALSTKPTVLLECCCVFQFGIQVEGLGLRISGVGFRA